jgi:hypothetical protein
VRQEFPGGGREARWDDSAFDDQGFQDVWLSDERRTIRDFYLLGPFDNEDHRGYFEKLPPEVKVDLGATYPGKNGVPISWERHSASLQRPVFNQENYAYETTRGPFAASSRIVDVGAALGIESEEWNAAVAYAVTYVRAEHPLHATLEVAAQNFRAWVNGREVLKAHQHPWYYEFRQPWAFHQPVDLVAGYNELLIKLERGDSLGLFPLQFWARFVDEHGAAMLLETSPDRRPLEKEPVSPANWFRITLPPGTQALDLPQVTDAFQAFVDGVEVAAARGAATSVHIPITAREGSKPQVLAVRIERGGEIVGEPRATMTTASIALGSLMSTGLRSYSGRLEYTVTFDAPPRLIADSAALDLGQVGVTCEAFLNGEPLGTRIFSPFRYDVSHKLKEKGNELRVIVANTMSNRFAVADRKPVLAAIDLDGLHGPVTIEGGEGREASSP